MNAQWTEKPVAPVLRFSDLKKGDVFHFADDKRFIAMKMADERWTWISMPASHDWHIGQHSGEGVGGRRNDAVVKLEATLLVSQL